MKKRNSSKKWAVLSAVMLTLLAVITTGTAVANEYAPLINANLQLQNYKMVEEGDGSDKIVTAAADYDTPKEIQDYFNRVCEDLEAEGLVLLKNDNNALPLSKTSKVSLFGTGSVNINCSVQGMRNTTSESGGSSSESGLPTLKDAFANLGVEVNPSLWDFYTIGAGKGYGGEKKLNPENNIQTYYINEVPWTEYASVRNSFASYDDAAIAVFTRDSTEGSDANAIGSDGIDGSYLSLSPEESELLKQLTVLKNNGTFKKVVVLLNGAQPIELDFLDDPEISVDSCMWIGNTGMSGVHAVAKAIIGDVVPSGRATDTFTKDHLTSPVMASWMLNDNGVFSNKWDDSRLSNTQSYYGVYVEGIYVGYRYYETRYADVVEGRANVGNYTYTNDVAYAFGSGLSYTEFEYSDMTVEESADGKSYDVTVTVTNIGTEYTGKEVVQIYLQKPYTDYAIQNAMEVSAIELVGFEKTEPLAPGASQEVTVNVEKTLFASYDTYGAATYVLDAGDYYLTAGKDAHDALNNVLSKKGYTTANGMTEEGDADLVWKNTVATLDTETYSTSDQTGYEITNQLSDYDPNTYVGGGSNYITYVSRNDWTGTWPKTKALLTLTDAMYKALQSNNPVKSEGSMPELGQNNGLTLAMLRGKDFNDEDWDKLLAQMTFDDMNTLLTTAFCQTAAIESVVKPQTKEMDGPTYCKESKNGCRLPCEGIWAATFNKALIEEAGVALANDCLYTGYHGMWIPGINIHRSPFSGRNHEYFSEDPYLTGVAAEVEIKGIQKYDVIAFPKHYIFTDQEANRNGIGIWLNEQSAREIYVQPWKYACGINKGNAHGIMTSFNRSGCAWTSASYGLVTEILRNEIGFEGFIITDMADANGTGYMSCIDGIVAGTDTWLSSGKNHSFAEYKNNATVVNAMKDACHRTLYAVCNYSASMNGYSPSTKIVRVYLWWEIALTAAVVVIGIVSAGSVVMYCISKRKDARDM